MRRAPALALALALPTAALIGGSAAASTPSHAAPTTASSNSIAGSMSGMDMSGMDMTGSPTSHALRPPHKANKIKGSVGPGFTIKVSPTSVKAGKYKLVVQDKGDIHNFHIFGPGGVDEATSVSGTGKTVWKLILVKGTYTVQCDPHSGSMKTSLKVT